MSVSEADVKQQLNAITIPELDNNLVDAGWLKAVDIDGNQATLRLVPSFPCQSQYADYAQKIAAQLESLSLTVAIDWAPRVAAYQHKAGVESLKGVKNIIAVASGKGGVGKSTTSVNLALALVAEGAKVGLLDADIYGPSQPIMLGKADSRPETLDQKRILPVLSHGVQSMSIGYLVDPEQAMVWRGPMASGALQQLINDTQWQDLDYLIVDLPPGTGDIQLTLSQRVPVTAAVVVTTPQDIALADAVKAMNMFEKVSVPVLGVIENMGVHICSECGHAEHIFGEGGGAGLAENAKIEFLGSLPLARSIRDHADSGTPSVVAEPDGTIAQMYQSIARKIAASLSTRAKDYSQSFPNISITND
ncbi:iron-sulfur cluster carrier protein ApbC [Pleionea litopenaei]|uniref:Iron-sulfur cluster carrier protein n=1 Tax=Pleionea litopenaei TaxID=3070815 RepID=A0AA51RU37_9GAMM|nr:iron-sulfur cluster carrier protein ApbC [Pleionea sp. HL-JVS1]WMS87494.1 iron-sulfur cluster carrier protein ApbC [Pleionea sp. HL-JVS1]